jgi:hypothetical protein
MKKLLFVAVIGALVACGEASTEETKVDSPVAPVEAPATPDTTATATPDTTAAAATADTTKK